MVIFIGKFANNMLMYGLKIPKYEYAGGADDGGGCRSG